MDQSTSGQPQESTFDEAPIGPAEREQAAIGWLQHALDGEVGWRTAVASALCLLRKARLERSA